MDNTKIINSSQLNAERIMSEIMSLVESGIPYIEAIVHFAEKNEIEIEVVGEIVRRSPILKAKVHYEAEQLNMVDSVSRLPV